MQEVAHGASAGSSETAYDPIWLGQVGVIDASQSAVYAVSSALSKLMHITQHPHYGLLWHDHVHPIHTLPPSNPC